MLVVVSVLVVGVVGGAEMENPSIHPEGLNTNLVQMLKLTGASRRSYLRSASSTFILSHEKLSPICWKPSKLQIHLHPENPLSARETGQTQQLEGPTEASAPQHASTHPKNNFPRLFPKSYL